MRGARRPPPHAPRRLWDPLKAASAASSGRPLCIGGRSPLCPPGRRRWGLQVGLRSPGGCWRRGAPSRGRGPRRTFQPRSESSSLTSRVPSWPWCSRVADVTRVLTCSPGVSTLSSPWGAAWSPSGVSWGARPPPCSASPHRLTRPLAQPPWGRSHGGRGAASRTCLAQGRSDGRQLGAPQGAHAARCPPGATP